MTQHSYLDYEAQNTFSLISTATDGGGQMTMTNVEDLNDNVPVFDQPEYSRRVGRIGDIELQPPLIVKVSET